MSEIHDVALYAADYDFRVRVYPAERPDGTMLVWMHGGAFMFGSLEMPEADAVGRALSAAGSTVVSVDYTLAPLDALPALPPPPPMEGMPTPEQMAAEMAAAGPRAPFPVASLQVVAAFDWATANAASFGAVAHGVGVGGASAGGNLAAGAGLRIRDRGDQRPSSLLLIYPVLHNRIPDDTDGAFAKLLEGLPEALTFPPDASAAINKNYVGPGSLDDPYAFPGGHDVHGLPPTLIVAAERDRLRLSSDAFADELRAAGVTVEQVTEAGALHGFLNEHGEPAERTHAAMHRMLRSRV